MEDKMTELRLYSPLTGDLYAADSEEHEEGEGYDPETPDPLDSGELVPFAGEISTGIGDESSVDETERGLMAYFYGSETVDEKVASLRPTVEEVDGKLYGVAVCQTRGTLTPEELAELKEFCVGQYADGWGEGFEQRPRQTACGELCVHFWQNKGFYLRTAQEMGFAREAPERVTTVRHIDKDGFWTLLEETKQYFGQDTRSSAEWLKKQLRAMGPEEALRFHAFEHCYNDAADRYGLWNAAAVMIEDGCTDDGFLDFRAWLIAQGKAVYMNGLKDPDSLAAVEPYNGCSFESLSYVGHDAYEALTGKSAYDADLPEPLKRELATARREIQYGPGIEYPHEWREMGAYLPNLCAKHLTPEELAFKSGQQLWNYGSPDIQIALKLAEKKKNQPKRGGGAR